MNKIWVIARKDISETFRSRSTWFIILIMIILAFTYISGYESHIKTLTNQQDVNAYSGGFLNSLAYVLPIMYSIFICSAFANYAVIVDKAKRNIENLMATPVSIKQIWLGKSLAVTIPSIMVGYIVAILVYLAMAIILVMPKTHAFIFPSILAIVSALIIVPTLIFSIVCIVTYIQLIITNPRIASFVFSGIFIILLFGVNALGGFGISLNYFAWIYLGIAGICAAISYFLSFSLTKEKVLLSSKM